MSKVPLQKQRYMAVLNGKSDACSGPQFQQEKSDYSLITARSA